VAGSYDRSVRIFPTNGGHSREIYHTKRMQRVFAVRFSGDGSYVFSGSDDMNVRVWKAEASAQLGVTLPREKHKQAYQKALVGRYKHLPEIKKVVRHRNVPKPIYKVRIVFRGLGCLYVQKWGSGEADSLVVSGGAWCSPQQRLGLTPPPMNPPNPRPHPPGRQDAALRPGRRQAQAGQPHQAFCARQRHGQAGAEEEDHR
jgi:hypothetical protein